MTSADKLAIEGGRPSVPAHLVEHDWERFRKATREEIDAVTQVLESGHLSIAQGFGMPEAEGLEKEFAQWVEADHCLVVNSGTAALHCAMAGVGVEPGDEVLVPAFTFIASVMVVLHQNAVPVFVDIDPETYLIDPAKIEEKITRRTKAIIPVHIYGLPADMQPINEIAGRHGLKIIEDCAQSYGALYQGRKTGSLGDAAGFSMSPTKQLMTGEGGMMTTNNLDILQKGSMLRLFGELCDMKDKDRAYMSEEIGWNYKLPEVCSALARVKLRNLNDYLSGTQQNAAALTDRLATIAGLIIPRIPPDRTHAYYLYPVKVDPAALNLEIEPGRLKNAVLNALVAENVRAGLWQKVPVPAQPLFQNRGVGNYDLHEYPNSFSAIEGGFTVRGLVPPNGNELVDAYADAFEKVFQNIDRALAIYDKKEKYIPVEERIARLGEESSLPTANERE